MTYRMVPAASPCRIPVASRLLPPCCSGLATSRQSSTPSGVASEKMLRLETMKQVERFVLSSCSPMQKLTTALCDMMAAKNSHSSRAES